MIFTAETLNTKLKQDHSDVAHYDSGSRLVLCDGIGEFEDSQRYSETVVDEFVKEKYSTLKKLCSSNALSELKKTTTGGTTVITAQRKKSKSDKLNIQYLGNGGALHLGGDFNENIISDFPYRYHSLLLPHINKDGKLIRFISHNSGAKEEKVSRVDLTLNNPFGDLVMFYTDGISSLEDRMIIQDESEDRRYWRHESSDIQYILQSLTSFLRECDYESFEDEFRKFSKTVLKDIHKVTPFDDDASIGFVVTQEFVEYHKGKK